MLQKKKNRHLFRRYMTETEEAKAHNIIGMARISRKILFPLSVMASSARRRSTWTR